MTPTYSLHAKRIVWLVVLLLALLLATLLVKPLLLRHADQITLTSAPELSGQISQALTTTAENKSLPVAGKDFTLTKTMYFNNQDWVVTSVVPSSKVSETSVAVLKKQDGMYQVILGPGTSFARSSLTNVPANVAGYLTQQGAIYDTVN